MDEIDDEPDSMELLMGEMPMPSLPGDNSPELKAVGSDEDDVIMKEKDCLSIPDDPSTKQCSSNHFSADYFKILPVETNVDEAVEVFGLSFPQGTVLDKEDDLDLLCNLFQQHINFVLILEAELDKRSDAQDDFTDVMKQLHEFCNFVRRVIVSEDKDLNGMARLTDLVKLMIQIAYILMKSMSTSHSTLLHLSLNMWSTSLAAMKELDLTMSDFCTTDFKGHEKVSVATVAVLEILTLSRKYPPFPCDCVNNFLSALKNQFKEDFWQSLEILLNPGRSDVKVSRHSYQIHVDHVQWPSELYWETARGLDIGDEDHSYLEKHLKTFLTTLSLQTSSKEFRMCLKCNQELVRKTDKPRLEVLTTFWSLFEKRINQNFKLQTKILGSSSINGLAVLPQKASVWFQSLQDQVQDAVNVKDVFTEFLNLLVLHLKTASSEDTAAKSKVAKQFFRRILSNLTASKFEALDQCGKYNMLTMISTLWMARPELQSKALLSIIGSKNPGQVGTKRCLITTKGLAVLILTQLEILGIEDKQKRTLFNETFNSFMARIDLACSIGSLNKPEDIHEVNETMKVYCDLVSTLMAFGDKKALILALPGLVSPKVVTYAEKCACHMTKDSSSLGLSSVIQSWINVVTNLRRYLADMERSDSGGLSAEEVQLRQDIDENLVKRLNLNGSLYVCLRTKICQSLTAPHEDLAELLMAILLLNANKVSSQEFCKQFEYFAMSHTVPAKMSLALLTVFTEGKAREVLRDNFGNLSILLEGWLRCAILLDDAQESSVQQLSAAAKQHLVTVIANDSTALKTSDLTVKSFLNLVGQEIARTRENSSKLETTRKTFMPYLNVMMKCLKTSSSSSFVKNILLAGNLVESASAIIYNGEFKTHLRIFVDNILQPFIEAKNLSLQLKSALSSALPQFCIGLSSAVNGDFRTVDSLKSQIKSILVHAIEKLTNDEIKPLVTRILTSNKTELISHFIQQVNSWDMCLDLLF